METPGFSLEETSEGGHVSHTEGQFERFSITFDSDPEFDSKTYVPVMPFSGGGAAVYSGHFSGDVLCDQNWHSVATTFVTHGLKFETTLLPAWASESHPVYVYFGELMPKEAEQVVMIIDPEMPQWLKDTFMGSVPAATSVFSELLQFELADKPLVLVSAGELEDFGGYSVKGAGLDGQFTIMLRGRDLLEQSFRQKKVFQKMVAHELLHVWQQAMPGGGFNMEQPWLHEGSADALAVAALAEAGLWSAQDVEEFYRQQKETCAVSLADSDLGSAADSGNWTAIYACGYLEFTTGVDDPFKLWLQLTRAAHEQGKPYSQELLDSILPSR